MASKKRTRTLARAVCLLKGRLTLESMVHTTLMRHNDRLESLYEALENITEVLINRKELENEELTGSVEHRKGEYAFQRL
jgi:hypothetical protein